MIPVDNLKSENEITAKKSYTAPQLTEYGNIAKLTQGSGSPGVEGGSMFC